MKKQNKNILVILEYFLKTLSAVTGSLYVFQLQSQRRADQWWWPLWPKGSTGTRWGGKYWKCIIITITHSLNLKSFTPIFPFMHLFHSVSSLICSFISLHDQKTEQFDNHEHHFYFTSCSETLGSAPFLILYW